MAYAGYATQEDYAALFPDDTAPPTAAALRTASRHIDSLTFDRIVWEGFENLTAFQRELVTEVVCRQARFETDYAELLESTLASYSINGVSMRFGGGADMYAEDGVVMRRDVYALLRQTGLCVRAAGWLA